MKKKLLGIIGGMGPIATADFYERIIRHTAADKDQDHLDMVIINHASMIDRTYALENGYIDILLSSLEEDIKALENMHVKSIAIPCNTCCTICDKIQKLTKIPIINMIEETVKHISKTKDRETKIGIIATDGTIKSETYQKLLTKYHIPYLVPDGNIQKEIMNIIYEEVKKDNFYNVEHFDKVLDYFVKHGCTKVILGCTEVSGFKKYYPDLTIDPMDVLVKACIKKCDGKYE